MKQLLTVTLSLLLLTGCTGVRQEEPMTRTTFAMDTWMELQAYGPHAETGLDACTRELGRLSQLLDVTQPDSEVWALNHSGGAPLAVSTETAELLTAAAQVWDRSGGALDVTLYPVVRSWGFTTDEYRIPEPEELADLLTRVDTSAVELNDGAVTLPAGMELDFGSIAKGYAGERCAGLMEENGVESALLMLGGNIQTVGSKPDGSPWRVYVQAPSGEEGAVLGIAELNPGEAAVTSGGYQRYFEKDGVRYWHILDPKTGAPARSGLTSVTIVGDSGTRCDALSTALFVLGREAGLDYWRTYGGFEAILADEDNQLWVTAGLADRFTLAEDSGYTLNLVEE